MVDYDQARLTAQGATYAGYPDQSKYADLKEFSLAEIEKRLTAAIGAVGSPTQEQVDAAVEKALPAALAAAGLSLEAIAKAVNDDAAARLQN